MAKDAPDVFSVVLWYVGTVPSTNWYFDFHGISECFARKTVGFWAEYFLKGGTLPVQLGNEGLNHNFSLN